MPDEPQEELDETFEIISEKEKLWRDKLVEAETSYLNSEANMAMAVVLIALAKAEIKKEADTYAK